MSDISALPGDIVDWLKGMQELEHIKFISEYPPQDKAVPLRQNTEAEGLERVDIKDSFSQNDDGVLLVNEYCRLALLRIRLAIHVPFAMGGRLCHDSFADVIDCLTFASDLQILNSGCGDIRADRDTDALVLDAFIEVSADFCPALASGLHFKSFLDKELLCGSHIRDASIHVTQADKELWNEAFVTGSYFGNQKTDRSFDLGFKPRFVSLYAVDCPPMSFDFDENKAYFYTAAAFDGGGSRGLEINNKGFKLLSGPSHEWGGARPRLNEPGYDYFYIAFK